MGNLCINANNADFRDRCDTCFCVAKQCCIFFIWSACAAENYCFKNLSTLSTSVLRIQIYSSYTQTLHASDKPITNSIRNVHQAFLCVHPTLGFHLKVNILGWRSHSKVSKAFNDLKLDESRGLGNPTKCSIFEAVMTPIRALTFNSHKLWSTKWSAPCGN